MNERVCKIDRDGGMRIEGEMIYIDMVWEDTGEKFELETSKEQFYSTLIELQLTLRAHRLGRIS